MFAAILDPRDARRATTVANRLLAHELEMALTGGLAIEAQLRAHGRPFFTRPLNDLDFVVRDFAAIPPALAGEFAVIHVHPDAAEGKTLLQLVDIAARVRVDLFRAFGKTLLRSEQADGDTDPLRIVAVEDLVARTTAHVCAVLGRGRSLDPKHSTAFKRLLGLGRPDVLHEAWRDHREDPSLSFADATREALRLVALRPELLVQEEYSAVATPCGRCRDHGPFRPSTPEAIVRILGYC